MVAKVGIGAVVPTGTPKPPIGSADELKRALLGATTIVYAFPAGGGAAGIHIAKMIERLGIAEQIKPKTRFGLALPHAGKGLPLVSSPNGKSALPTTKARAIRATGLPSV